MTIHITELNGGRLIECETQAESAALTELSLSISKDNWDGTKNSKKAVRRIRRAWLRFEKFLGRELPMTAGIAREFIFAD